MENVIVENIMNINWIATIAGFVAAFVLGALWFSPMMFGKKWAEGVGVKLEKGAKMPMMPMLTQAIGTFLLAWLVGITASIEHLLTILIALFAFAFLKYADGGFSQKSTYATVTESSYILVMGIIMIAAHAIL